MDWKYSLVARNCVKGLDLSFSLSAAASTSRYSQLSVEVDQALQPPCRMRINRYLQQDQGFHPVLAFEPCYCEGGEHLACSLDEGHVADGETEEQGAEEAGEDTRNWPK